MTRKGRRSSLKQHLSQRENPLVSLPRGVAGAYDGVMANVVVIEDEPGIVDFIERGLTAGGFTVSAAGDGETGLELALGERVDLVVLDLMLPRRSGIEILRDLTEQRPGLPVIVLTARGEVEDRVKGLRAGAVDYLVKPFALAELDARIHAQLRAARQAPETVLRRAGLAVDLIARRVSHDGEPIRLTTTEFDLLAYFLHNSGQAMTMIRPPTTSTSTSAIYDGSCRAPTAGRSGSPPCAPAAIAWRIRCDPPGDAAMAPGGVGGGSHGGRLGRHVRGCL